jgi:undecaprenyl-diphosphatase
MSHASEAGPAGHAGSAGTAGPDAAGLSAQPDRGASWWRFPLAWPQWARRTRVLAAVAAVSGAVFLTLALLVDAGWESGFRLDARIASWADEFVQSHERYEELVSMVTHLGDSLSVGVFAGFATVILLGHRLWRSFWFLFVTLGVGFLGAYVMKYVVDRPRPPSEFGLEEFSPSFPSGHTTGSTLLWLALFLLIIPWEPRSRWPWIGFFSVGMLTVVAASRVLLAAHYLSDVLAGLCWGLAWVCLSLLLVQPWKEIEGIRERQGRGTET